MLTVSKQVQELSMFIDRFLDAQNSNLSQLVIEDPFRQCRLYYVRSIETRKNTHDKSISGRSESRGNSKETHQSIQFVRTTEVCLIWGLLGDSVVSW